MHMDECKDTLKIFLHYLQMRPVIPVIQTADLMGSVVNTHDPKSFACHSLISLIACEYLVNWCTILVHIHPEMAKLLVQKGPINDRTHQIIDLVSVLWFVYYFNDLNLQMKAFTCNSRPQDIRHLFYL